MQIVGSANQVNDNLLVINSIMADPGDQMGYIQILHNNSLNPNKYLISLEWLRFSVLCAVELGYGLLSNFEFGELLLQQSWRALLTRDNAAFMKKWAKRQYVMFT